MSEREPSKTALGVAALRAVHQMNDAAPKILDDPIILKLLEPTYLDFIRDHPERYQNRPTLGLRAHVVIRSRYAEDRLAKAVERGVRQYVSLGAGLDTFAYRQPEWAKALRIFEVDQPARQREKRERLEKADIAIPNNVEFVAIDFEKTSLEEGMRASGFDFSHPAFFSWLGVMVYLSWEAVDAVFRFVAKLPRSSEIVFTFSPPASPEEAERTQPSLADRAAELGEPFKTRITPEDLTVHLHTLGFTGITIPTLAEINDWYIHGRQDGLGAGRRQTIASAMV